MIALYILHDRFTQSDVPDMWIKVDALDSAETQARLRWGFEVWGTFSYWQVEAVGKIAPIGDVMRWGEAVEMQAAVQMALPLFEVA